MDWVPDWNTMEVATVLLAVWGGLDLVKRATTDLVEWWKKQKEQRLRQEYPGLYSELSPEAKQLVHEEPPFWYARLFGRLLSENLNARKTERLDLRLQTRAWDRQSIELVDGFSWIRRQNSMLRELMGAFSRLTERGLGEAFESEGEARDPAILDHIAAQIGEVYEQAIHLGIRYQQAHIDEDFEPLLDSLSNSVNVLLDGIDELERKMRTELEALVEEERKRRGILYSTLPTTVYEWVEEKAIKYGYWEDREGPTINIQVELDPDVLKEVEIEMERLRQEKGW